MEYIKFICKCSGVIGCISLSIICIMINTFKTMEHVIIDFVVLLFLLSLIVCDVTAVIYFGGVLWKLL